MNNKEKEAIQIIAGWIRLNIDIAKHDAITIREAMTRINVAEDVMRGLEQLEGGRGFSPDAPLDDVGYMGLYALAEILGYEVVSQAQVQDHHGCPRCFLDRHELEGMSFPSKIILYNRIYDDEDVEVPELNRVAFWNLER